MRNMLKSPITVLALGASLALMGTLPAKAQEAVTCVNCSQITTQGLQWAEQVSQYADSDDRGHQFQSDRGHHSDLMAAT
jgi:hypothetical protein